MSHSKTVSLTLVKSTKGTHVYGNQADDAAIQSVYIKKDALPATPPAAIKIEITWE